MNYSAITIQGNIISGEILEKIRTEPEYAHQNAKYFGLEKRGELRDAIGTAWAEARTLWELYKHKVDKLPEGDAGTTLTRKFWIMPLLYELGYDLEMAEVVTEAGRTFNISHCAQNIDNFPVLVMGYYDSLDRKPERHTIRVSPHALVQEYLNYTEHLFGLVTNGRSLRLLRDSNRLTKLAYLEFDLERMMEEDLYHEFAMLYRLLHATRMPKGRDEAEKSFIEYYHQESIDSGSRIRESLRNAVEEAMTILANGTLSHPANEQLRQAVTENNVDAREFYHLLLRVMYRIIFLATIEERDLVYPQAVGDKQKQEQFRLKKIYEKYYSLNRLRNLALSPVYIDPRKNDLWQGLLSTFRLFEPVDEGEKLGLLPLGGDLFGKDALSNAEVNLYDLRLDNRSFLQLLSKLTIFVDERGQLTRVNYRDLDVEELGSVYESLLELHPYFDTKSVKLKFGFTQGSERKTTGSYYTRHDLVAQLIKSALIPVMEERLKQTGWDIRKKGNEREAEQALLGIKVCDPAAGSGHFLLAAARILGFNLAKIRSSEENPGEEFYLPALRDVIEHCIHGVDLNQAAVELCRLSLWLIGHNKGKPLTFLEHKIKCGNSLVGIDKLERIIEGIPEGAYKPLTGDDKATAAYYKKLNTSRIKGRQYSIFMESKEEIINHEHLKANYQVLEDRTVDTIQDFEWKRNEYVRIRSDEKFRKALIASNLFTYAFFQRYEENQEDKDTVTSETIVNFIMLGDNGEDDLIRIAEKTAEDHHFFQWPLEFPDVFEKGGFDVILGNPPWEKINLEDKEFFESKDPSISAISKSSDRNKSIERLKQTNLKLYTEYHEELNRVNKQINFLKSSEIYLYGNQGLLNTYPLFIERSIYLINPQGTLGFVTPSGFFSDDTISPLFRYCLQEGLIKSIYDFENSKKIFPTVHGQTRFALITLSGKGKEPLAFDAKFLLNQPIQIFGDQNLIKITIKDIEQLNPNNLVCPSFRTVFEFNLNKKIYRYGVLKNDMLGNSNTQIHRMINMTTDSNLLNDNEFDDCLPLYESKLISFFDHRYATFEGVSSDEKKKGNANLTSESDKQKEHNKIIPRYFCSKDIFIEKNKNWQWEKNWYLAYRYISASTNERTSIASLIPASVVSNSTYLIFDTNILDLFLFQSLMNTLLFDFIARSKVNLNFPPVILFQSPCIRVKQINNEDLYFIILKNIELNYTSWDIKSFADDLWKESGQDLRQEILNQWMENKSETGGHPWQIPDWQESHSEIHWHSPMEKIGWTKEDLINYNEGCPLTPFKWDEERRTLLKAELNAYFALLYGLERDELRYILDPQDVYGEDYVGETFRILKEKDIRKYGEYRTRRLVLEAYDRLRPSWDMDAHMAKLNEVWEEYQNQSSKGKGQIAKLKGKVEQLSKAAETESVYKQTKLFEEPHLFSQEEKKVTTNTKVTLRRLSDGQEFHYHINPNAAKGSFTSNYKQILPDSALALAMIGLVSGGRFEFGGVEWEVVLIV